MNPLLPEQLLKISNVIKQFESFSETAYQDTGGKWTVGYGFTYLNHSAVTQHTVISRYFADIQLDLLIEEYYSKIRKHVSVPINFNQMLALTSFGFNVGLEALFSSTLLEDINHQNYSGAADELLRWNHVGKVVSLGLTNRRKQERAIFLTPCQQLV